MYNYNIPQNETFNQRNLHNYPKGRPPMNSNYNNNDRFLGNGFLGPFLLGGVGGYLLGRPNYNGPIPVYFPNNMPYPYPIYQRPFYY